MFLNVLVAYGVTDKDKYSTYVSVLRDKYSTYVSVLRDKYSTYVSVLRVWKMFVTDTTKP